MNSQFRKRLIRYPLAAMTLLGVIAAIALFTFHFWIGFIFTVLFVVLIGMTWRVEEQDYLETEEKIQSISYRMKRVGEEALLQMPIGIVLLDEHNDIEWANAYASHIFEMESLIGKSLEQEAKPLWNIVQKEQVEARQILIGERYFDIEYKQEDRLFYIFDVTQCREVESRYEAEQTVLGILLIDNYEELAQRMDDQTKSQMNSHVTSLLNEWALQHHIFMKRIASDRFFLVLNERILSDLEESKFAILDDIREKTKEESAGLTLSIGIGTGESTLIELGELAQSSLDLVLGRGGDQVAIKNTDGKLKFFGGKTNPVEKRTRVRARVISHALRDLIQGSDQVFVMGHKMPDMDAIGAAIGVRKMARMNNIEGYVVIDFNQLDASVLRLMKEIEKDEELYAHFIDPDTALSMMTERSLLTVVDTHKPSLVIDERVLQKADKIVLIDHHRRGEDFIDDAMLVYMEPYASSTAELVTELIEYQPKHERLTMLESTAMLAGIVVDTKSFTLRTGSRTFEAASYLRMNGADTILVQRLLKEDIDTYVKRAKLIEKVQVTEEGIAIVAGEPGVIYGPVLIAQTADILLSMLGVVASFVIAAREDGKIGISARSLGDVNVQVVMEKLGGGGHLTNAACQLEVDSVEEAERLLREALVDTDEGGNES